MKKETTAGPATLYVPDNNLSGTTTFFIDEIASDSTNSFYILKDTKLVNGSFYDIYALDKKGNFIHFFQKPIRITLPISKDQIGQKNLRLYWLNEVNWKWVLIPDAIFSGDKVTFEVDHLTKFAIFSLDEKKFGMTTKGQESLELPVNKKPTIESSVVPSEGNNAGGGESVNKNNFYKFGEIFLIVIVLILIIVFIYSRRGKK